MRIQAQEIFGELATHLEGQPCDGTLRALQRAVLWKAEQSLANAEQFPVVDLPLALHHAVGGKPEVGRVLAGACLLFYAFADVVDDAQDHDLALDPWESWGWEQAVNTGTSLLFQSLQYLYDCLPASIAGSVAEVFIRAGLQMTYGQHTDLRGLSAETLTLSQYLLAVERKSGASFGAYAKGVAVANAMPLAEAAAYQDFGRSLGMMFQMMNDVYELWMPKTSPDFVNRRLTFPIVLGLEQLKGSCREQLLEQLQGTTDFEAQCRLVEMLEASGIKEYATLRIELLRRRAEGLAEKLGFSNEAYVRQLLDTPAFPQTNTVV